MSLVFTSIFTEREPHNMQYLKSFFRFNIPLFLLALVSCFISTVSAREEAWEEELQYEARVRINMMIKGLDAPYSKRKAFVDELVAMAGGKLHTLMLQQLSTAIKRGNAQITEGIIEVFTRVDDESKIPALENELLYNQAPDVRLSIILHLPVFCVSSSQERGALLDLLESGERNLPERLINDLRTMPLDPKTGKYNIQLDEDIRGRVEKALSWQLNPVEAIIEFGLEKRNQDRALLMLKYFLDIDLGYSKKSWMEFWKSRGRTYQSPAQDEILETQINACRMLGFMGAEGSALLCEQIRWIMTTPYNNARQAALEMLADITDFARHNQSYLQKQQQSKTISQSEEIWIKRRMESFRRLTKLTIELAGEYTGDDNESIRIALLECLGATGDEEASKYVAQALRIDGKSHTLRMHAIRVLGELGTMQSVIMLKDAAQYRAIAVNRELQIQEYQRIRAAFCALSNVVGTVAEGKLTYSHQKASQEAFAYLTDALGDSRQIEGSPKNDSQQETSMRFFARKALQQSFNTNENSYKPENWQKIYNDLTHKAEQAK